MAEANFTPAVAMQADLQVTQAAASYRAKGSKQTSWTKLSCSAGERNRERYHGAAFRGSIVRAALPRKLSRLGAADLRAA